MKRIKKSFRFAAVGAIMLASTASASSTLNYRMHYLTEAGNSEPGFPYPYVGVSEFYCDDTIVTYGKVTSNQEYEFVSNC